MLVEGWRSARTADIRSIPPPIKVLPIDVLASVAHTPPRVDFDEIPFSTDWERIR